MPDTNLILKPIGSQLLLLVAILGLLVATIQSAPAQTYNVLYNFCSQPNCADGYAASGPLVQDKNGNLYGTTVVGGTGPKCDGYHSGCGTVFELSPAGTYTVLHSFTGSPDGQDPSSLVFDRKGNLYGTTYYGGVYNSGTIFEITSSGTEKALYSFTGGVDGSGGTDGAYPNGPLVRDAKGNLYGTTIGGGTYYCPNEGCGTVFELSPNATETTLYTFTGNADDGNPFGGVVRDAQGNLYGTTAQQWDFGPMPGTVFKLTPSGVETQIYSFLGGTDGSGPYGGLVRDAKGNLYGTTYYGGIQSCSDGIQNGCGVVFKVTPSGKETVRHRFTGRKDGGYPTTGLVEDAQGNSYGTTPSGGDPSCGCGVIFMIPTKGKEVVLHTFTGGADGGSPQAGLLRDAKGNLYGTTVYGGANGQGVVFKVTP